MHLEKEMETSFIVERQEPIASTSTNEIIAEINQANAIRAMKEERRAKAIERFQNIHKKFRYCVLIIPASAAIILIVSGILLVWMFAQLKWHCDMNEKPNGSDDSGPCFNVFLENHYPSPSVELYLAFIILAGVTRFIITATMYGEVRKYLDVKHVGTYLLLTGLIIMCTAFFTGMMYGHGRHEEDPHNPDHELYEFCLLLSIVFMFCFSDAIVTLSSMAFLHLCKCHYVDTGSEHDSDIDDFDADRRRMSDESTF